MPDVIKLTFYLSHTYARVQRDPDCPPRLAAQLNKAEMRGGVHRPRIQRPDQSLMATMSRWARAEPSPE